MFDYSTLPHHMQDAAKLYIEQGIPGGSFMTAVFANDLCGAYGRADTHNKQAMQTWVEFMQWEVPGNCHGSYEIVEAWKGIGPQEVQRPLTSDIEAVD